MRKLFHVLYYFYYLFYTRVIPENQPHSTTVFTLSVTESLIVNGLIKIIIAYTFQIWYTKWIDILVFCIILVLNIFIFYRSGLGVKIIKEKPVLLKSIRFSKLITILFFATGILYLFLGPFVILRLINK